MGNGQSQRQEDYTIEGNTDEPVIIREVKQADKPGSAPRPIPVLFKWQEAVADHATGVSLSGTFNNWQRQPMKLCDNEYIESLGKILQFNIK